MNMFLKSIPALLLCLSLMLAPALEARAQEEKVQYQNWEEVAEAMIIPLEQAVSDYAGGAAREDCRDLVNKAYFGFYEKEGFERNVKARISGKRASRVEYKFATIKGDILAGKDAGAVASEIQTLISWLREDARKLDDLSKAQVAKQDAPQQGAQQGAVADASSQGAGAATTPPPAGQPQGGGGDAGWGSFVAALTILLREGFEAILVIAAIAAYLRRSGNIKAIRVVYLSSVAAVVVSFLTAIALQKLFTVSGQNQEILEGATMLLATVVLFFVSNWMFSKAEGEAWKNYIEGKVQSAVVSGSSFALGSAAFLAVFREGAETILFYQSILVEAGARTDMVLYGFLLGCVGLAAIFVIIRHGTMRLPIKPFFFGTSILMFIMSIAFAGGGIKELQEGDVIGVTMLDFVPTIDILGIYPTVQTLVPQGVMLALAILSIVWIKGKSRAAVKEAREAAAA
jgi:high-affinity iron transporter